MGGALLIAEQWAAGLLMAVLIITALLAASYVLARWGEYMVGVVIGVAVFGGAVWALTCGIWSIGRLIIR